MDHTTSAFYDHSTAKRVNTDIVVLQAIRAQHPRQHISIIPQFSANLFQYASAGHASAIPLDDGFKDPKLTTSLKWRGYLAPARRLDSTIGGLADFVHFGKFQYTWKEHEFTLYIADGRDGTSSYPQVVNQYLVGGDRATADELTLLAGQYSTSLHDEIWLFDQGFWQKDRGLWQSIQKSLWENVIIDDDMKESLRGDVSRFFSARKEYEKLEVPWKRGIIFHGPPGNGKTISIKATMHMLYERKNPVPTLYVKTLASYAPPEFSLGAIFQKARQEAPCYLVFEDLDSVVSDQVRSFFLNEVDGLSNNDGILMVGSTNHLELLDPGISKRPSRFDRKFFFPNPNEEQREKYCHFWQGKLSGNKEVEFPDRLCREIAGITDGFSFAYIQEAFVAALLVIAGRKISKFEEVESDDEKEDWEVVDVGKADKGGNEPDLNDYVLWVEIKKQVALLRKELETDKAEPQVECKE